MRSSGAFEAGSMRAPRFAARESPHAQFWVGANVGFIVFCTRRTTSAKRVALVGAPRTTAINSRPSDRTQVARQ